MGVNLKQIDKKNIVIFYNNVILIILLKKICHVTSNLFHPLYPVYSNKIQALSITSYKKETENAVKEMPTIYNSPKILHKHACGACDKNKL